MHTHNYTRTHILLRKEGVTQVGVSMVLYGVILYVLVEQIWGEYPGFTQSWYVGYFITAGSSAHLKTAIVRIEALGYARGVFLEQDK